MVLKYFSMNPSYKYSIYIYYLLYINIAMVYWENYESSFITL